MWSHSSRLTTAQSLKSWTRAALQQGYAFDYEGRRTFDVLLPTAVFLLLIPSIDETIQLFVPGRAGMITDVMIDCCGAATGVVLRYLLRSLMCAKKAA